MNLQENKGVIRVFLQILLSNLPRFQGFFRERCTLFQGRLPMRQKASASTALHYYNETIFVQIDDTAVENFTLDFIHRASEDRLTYPDFRLPSSEAEKKKSKTPVSRSKTHASKKHTKRYDPSLSLETPITHKFKRTQQVRKFLKAKAGGTFIFSKELQTYIAIHPEGTLGDILHVWKKLYRK